MANENNNARVGFTLQKLICEKYNIIPETDEAMNQFSASFDYTLKGQFIKLIDSIFLSLKLEPTYCTTFSIDEYGKEVPYNFILSDNSTLSIRTNMKGCKVAPRIVGQAGFEKLNKYFASIYGKEIVNQDDIKKLMIYKIEDVLPIFFDHLFDADYILWVYKENDIYKFHLIRGDTLVDIEYKKEFFSFTRDYNQWTESTTLKYKGVSIAEIQVHKARSFKFRFIMANVIPLFVAKTINNETLGITAEKTICDIFSLPMPVSFLKRYSAEMSIQLKPVIINAFTKLPNAIKHTGSEKGARGKESKCPYDFILLNNKTLSLKTNIGKMVCPPEVGQPGKETCYLYFKHLIPQENHIDGTVFKTMVFNSIDKMLPIYLEHMFDSDFLLWIYKRDGCFNYKILHKDYTQNYKWDFTKISFTKQNLDDWNESNTLKYDNISIGEFQVHKNRDCYKFRFNFENLIRIIEG